MGSWHHCNHGLLTALKVSSNSKRQDAPSKPPNVPSRRVPGDHAPPHTVAAGIAFCHWEHRALIWDGILDQGLQASKWQIWPTACCTSRQNKSSISKMKLKFYDMDTNVQIYTWEFFCDMKDPRVQILVQSTYIKLKCWFYNNLTFNCWPS